MPSTGTQILDASFDPTGYANITGAQLLQLIVGALTHADKGVNQFSIDTAGVPNVPDANAHPNFQRDLWVRITAGAALLYQWNPFVTPDPTFLNWQQVAITALPANAIATSNIQDGAVTDSKITSVNYAKLIGIPATFAPGGSAGGDLTGTYPNPTISALAVTNAKLAGDAAIDANRAVGTNNIKAQAVDWTKIAVGGAALTVPQVNAGATGFQFVAPGALTRLLQRVKTQDNTPSSGAGTFAATSAPAWNTGNAYVSLDVNITPLNAGSTLFVEALVWAMSGAAGGCAIGLWRDGSGSANAVATAAQSGVTIMVPLLIKYAVASGSVAATKFSVRVGGTAAGTTYINQLSTGNNWGNTLLSYMEVTEYI